MATSGTFSFSPEVAEYCDEAFERCGIDPATLTARHLRSARRSLDLLFTDWSNRSVHLWKVKSTTENMVDGTATYNAPSGCVAILEMFIRRSGTDYTLRPIDRQEYVQYPDKDAEGLPSQYYFDRQSPTPTYTMYLVPENSTDVAHIYYLERIEDVGVPSNTLDVPHRWFEAVCSGLASKLAEKYAPEREQALFQKAELAFKRAYTEDRQRVPTKFRLVYRS